MATKKAATKAAPKETARLTIICNSNEECSVGIKGDVQTLTAALAGLMAEDDERNTFRQMMAVAIRVVLDVEEKKTTKKKKAVTKKAITKKAAPKKAAVKKK